MSRVLRERLEHAQASARALALELEQVPSGPGPMSPDQQRTLDALRAETLQLTRETGQREADLLAAESSRDQAERSTLQLRTETPSKPGLHLNPLVGILVVALMIFAEWDDVKGASWRLPVWVSLPGLLLSVAWLLRDAWQTGRADAFPGQPPGPPTP